MHQTFYIDVDEEITSVIDRLRKAKAKENIFVIPQRALVLQSVINLRLLKKEADKMKKQIMIVSQDEQVRTISEKVGILFQSSMKGIEESDEIKENLSPKVRMERARKLPMKSREKKKKAEEIGSETFFDEGVPVGISTDSGNSEKPGRENLINRELIKDLGDIQKKERGIFSEIKNADKFSIAGSRAQKEARIQPPIPSASAPRVSQSMQYRNPSSFQPNSNPSQFRKNMDPIKERNLNEIFRSTPPDEKMAPAIKPSFPYEAPAFDNKVKEPEEPVSVPPVSGKLKKFFLIFGLICFFMALLVGAYLFIPKAVVTVQLRSEKQTVKADVKGAKDLVSINTDESAVPLEIIEKEKEKSMTFTPESVTATSDQKAQGKVTIYNEYSTATQPLVATTRLLTTDGKLFRITKDVVVPGMSKVGEEEKPGAVEVDVVADKSGEEYEIGPSTFTIPGFEGGPKYEKFYAKSSDSMKLAEIKSSTGVKGTLTSQDIADAKNKVEDELAKEIEDEIKGELSSGQMLLGSDPDKEILSSSSSQTAGKSVENFDYSAKMKVSAMAVSREDLIKILRNTGEIDENIPDDSIEIKIVNPETDIETGKAIFEVQGEISLESTLDPNKFKSEVLGKSENQIKEILKNYPEIEGLEIDFSPNFLSSRVPMLGQRVEIKTVESD